MMDCREFERAWAEIDDCSLLPPLMEEHRRHCPACAACMEDVNAIRGAARQLLLTEPPSDAVWARIRGELERSGLIRDGARPISKAVAQRKARSRRWAWFPNMGLAYAATFLMALGATFYLLSGRTPVTTNVARVVAPAASQPAPATSALPAASEATVSSPTRDEAVRELVQTMPADRQAVYLTNWQSINTSIQQLQDYATAHPDDPMIRSQLFAAREHREWLWETMVRRKEF